MTRVHIKRARLDEVRRAILNAHVANKALGTDTIGLCQPSNYDHFPPSFYASLCTLAELKALLRRGGWPAACVSIFASASMALGLFDCNTCRVDPFGQPFSGKGRAG